jgi:CheY-like chemotaxis protein
MSVFVVGRFQEGVRNAVHAAIARTTVRVELFAGLRALVPRKVRRGDRPLCFFIDAQAADARAVVAWIRDQAHLFDVPVVAVVPAPTREAMQRAVAIGADDAVPLFDTSGMTRRAARLAEGRQANRWAQTICSALVCEPDERNRRLVGRALRCAGFEVAFASDLPGASLELRTGLADLLVFGEAASVGSVSGAVAGLRLSASEPDLPTVVVGRDRRSESSLGRLGQVRFMLDGQPLHHLLFHASELLTDAPVEMRATPRLLHSTVCAFRRAGELVPSYGMTRDISRQGLFVRTLDAPSPGAKVWLDLHAPGSQSSVHLRGDVVWTSAPHPSASSATPPGFGVKLDERGCPQTDLARYVLAYDDLLAEALEPASTPAHAATCEPTALHV